MLDGGLPAWKAAGYPLEAGEATPRPRRVRVPRCDARRVRDFDAVRAALDAGDAGCRRRALGAPRFRGEAPEPRPGLPSGHMPGARNLPLRPARRDRGRLVPPEKIRKLFQDAGVDLDRPVVTTCGSGVTAAVLLFALANIGKDDVDPL